MKIKLVSVLAATLLVGCSPPLSTPDPRDTPTPAKKAQDADIEAYFDALASWDPAKAKRAAGMAAPHSDAWAYATYVGADAQTQIDGGKPPKPFVVTRTDSGLKACPRKVSAAHPCAMITRIRTMKGRVSSFSVDGEGLRGRLLIGTGALKQVGPLGTAKLLAAYQRRESLVAVFELSSESEGFFLSTDTHYLSVDGRQTNATDGGWAGPRGLAEGVKANKLMSFRNAKLGGTIVLDAFADNAAEVANVSFDLIPARSVVQ